MEAFAEAVAAGAPHLQLAMLAPAGVFVFVEAGVAALETADGERRRVQYPPAAGGPTPAPAARHAAGCARCAAPHEADACPLAHCGACGRYGHTACTRPAKPQ
jgi:hypothetical protein